MATSLHFVGVDADSEVGYNVREVEGSVFVTISHGRDQFTVSAAKENAQALADLFDSVSHALYNLL